ncbi:sensor histidine kinase [Spirillospora sp. CA-255316]
MTVLAGYTVSILINALWEPGQRHLQVFVPCLAGIAALQLLHSTKDLRASPVWLRATTCTVQAVLTYLPLIWVPPWGSMAGFLAGSVLLVVPGRLRWALYAAVGASLLPSALVWKVSPANCVWLVESSLVTGLVIYAVSSLSAMVAAAHAARGELARMAVVREQLRAERQLSDVLGRDLAAMTGRYRLISDLLDGQRDVQHAKEKLAETKEIARKTLADVRRISQSYRRPTLRAEVESAIAKLGSAGIDATAEVPDAPLPAGAGSLLATALREVAAHLLGLVPGARCRISFGDADGKVSMHVDVDGAAPRDMDHLAARLADATLTTDPDDRGALRLTVTVPRGAAGELTLPEPAQTPDGRNWTPGTAVTVTTVVLSAYALVTAVFVLVNGVTGVQLAGSAVCFAVVSLLQIANSAGVAARWPVGLRAASLGVQAVATYVPLFFLGQQWAAMAGFLAGSFLLLVANPWRWGLYGAVVGSIALVLGLDGLPAISIAYGCVFTLLTGLVVYSLSALQTLVAEVRAAHGPLVRMAVVQERLRVARDLHDLLSYSLSAISLKTELTYRLLPGSLDRARQEATELLAVTRQALADVHHAAGGDPHISLAEEAVSARSTLVASGIEGTVDIACGDLRREVDTVMAIVLREATANILRHSKARVYVIRLTQEDGAVRLYVANDGAGTHDEQPAGGAGLQNLDARLQALGGGLTAGLDSDGWFRLTGVVPP